MDKKLEINVSTIITIVTFIFTAGIAYGKFTSLQEQVLTLERRLNNKVQIINEQQRDIHALEISLVELKTKVEPKQSDNL